MERDRGMDKAEGTAKIRSFIAIKLPQPLMTAIYGLTVPLRRLQLDAKWVGQDNYHLTLKFLGAITQEEITAIDGRLQTLRSRPGFDLTAEGWGMFPNTRRPSVFWLGLGGELEALQRLWQDLEDRLSEIGYPRDARFHPHVTLARFRSQAGITGLIDALRAQAAFSGLGSFRRRALPDGEQAEPLRTHL